MWQFEDFMLTKKKAHTHFFILGFQKMEKNFLNFRPESPFCFFQKIIKTTKSLRVYINSLSLNTHTHKILKAVPPSI